MQKLRLRLDPIHVEGLLALIARHADEDIRLALKFAAGDGEARATLKLPDSLSLEAGRDLFDLYHAAHGNTTSDAMAIVSGDVVATDERRVLAAFRLANMERDDVDLQAW